jgi:glycosyltransferase involved in cell wall biosynthesis
MPLLSVVIVCKNEAEVIGRTLQSVESLTDDIVLYDNGSSDGTQDIARARGAKVFEGNWEGFGKTKKKVVELARHDWVLSIDADEVLDQDLKESLLHLQFTNENFVYEIKFKNFFGTRQLKHGEWGRDKHIRLFNRRRVNWDEASVHEKLALNPDTRVLPLKGFILHQTVKDISEYTRKIIQYALLNATKYHLQGKRSSWIKLYLGPFFAFVKYYFFHLGFLDGWEGFVCARMTAFYTFLKYARLRELNRQS